jgi:hypothetical protein
METIHNPKSKIQNLKSKITPPLAPFLQLTRRGGTTDN